MTARTVAENEHGRQATADCPRLECTARRNLAAACTYSLGAVTGIFFLAWRKYSADPIVRLHAIQSILATGSLVLSQLAFSVLGTRVVVVVRPISLTLGLGTWAHLMYRAYRGEAFLLPIIGAVARSHANRL